MIQILFVDDEPNILDGLKRMLRPMRYEWEMSFARSGKEALEILKTKNVDVVVSDMRMPGMDGVQLLEEIRNSYPQTVRMILSGYSEKEMIMKSVGTAHQYLAKPCDAETLKAMVKRACALRDLLLDVNLRRLVSQLDTIPSLPALYRELMTELHVVEPSIKRIGDIIRRDLGMTLKILQIVNSAFFGLQRQISDVGKAVEYLGLDTISSLALGVGVFSQFDKNKSLCRWLDELWTHSTEVGVKAKWIALREAPEVAQDAFTAGLLHEVGKVVLASNRPEEFAPREKSSEPSEPAIEASAMLNAPQAQIGAYLLGLWGLPNAVVEAVAFHQTPSQAQTQSFTALTAVHLANALCHTSQPGSAPRYDVDYLSRLGLLGKIEEWRQTRMTE